MQTTEESILQLMVSLLDNYDVVPCGSSSDSLFKIGEGGVRTIISTRDKKIEFIIFTDKILAHIGSFFGPNTYYPLYPVKLLKPIKAVLMDLDGTSVNSEEFWIGMIQTTMSIIMGNPKFSLGESDRPFVSGHSVSEHLYYCLNKYCPDIPLNHALDVYHNLVQNELRMIVNGQKHTSCFKPAPGIKSFLLALRRRGIKIGLVTSGLYEKCYPEILSAFQVMGLGDPKDFYDVIITAGFRLHKGEFGTLGEITSKPHPWLYAEAGFVGLSIPFQERHSVIGIDDTGAGICSIRLAGFNAIGMSWGNIEGSGNKALCNHYCDCFEQVLDIIL